MTDLDFWSDDAATGQLIDVLERLQRTTPGPDRADQLRLLRAVRDGAVRPNDLDATQRAILTDLWRLALSSLGTPTARALRGQADATTLAEILKRSDQLGPSGHASSSPRHRTIFAVDIEGATGRTNAAKSDLRDDMYRMVEQSLRDNGITDEYRDPLIDRGDGILTLLHPTDAAPKTLLLAKVVPRLASLLAEHERSTPGPRLRLRVVVHAGEVHSDSRGYFGEALDVAFRLLEAPEVKQVFKMTTSPLLLVVSELIFTAIVQQGYDGIDKRAYTPVVTVPVGKYRVKGWACLPDINTKNKSATAPDANNPYPSPSRRILHAARQLDEQKYVV